MCANFKEAQDLLARDPSAPKQWHLFAISFDPETDTPSVLKSYARRYDYNPGHWSFLTGALIDVTALAEQFKLDFWRESGSISHNLRTVVIDPRGRVFKIFQSNEWTPAMLVEAMNQAVPASGGKP
jgi:protein SCO1/2